MGSSFAEMYSDFKDRIKSYNEKLDITPELFLRTYSRGLQKFQKKTFILQRHVTLALTSDVFVVPNDMICIKEVKDYNGDTLVQQEFDQYHAELEKEPLGFTEARDNFGYRRTSYAGSPNGGTSFPNNGGYNRSALRDTNGSRTDRPRLYTMYNRIISISDSTDDDTTLELYYIPDLPAFNRQSTAWTDFADPTTFMTAFQDTGLVPSFAPYEDCFLHYALCEYFEGKGILPMAQYYRELFKEETKEAEEDNVTMIFNNAVANYFMGPYA